MNTFEIKDDDINVLDYINRNYDLHAEYHISSHRRILGRLFVWGRWLVHGEIKKNKVEEAEQEVFTEWDDLVMG